MFKFQPKPTFRATVEISQPGEDVEPLRIPFIFRHMSRTESEQMIEEKKFSWAEAAPVVVVGWEIEDVPYTPEAYAYLVDQYPAAPEDIYRTWVSELARSKRKN